MNYAKITDPCSPYTFSRIENEFSRREDLRSINEKTKVK